jgi:hypothetical protein
MAELSNFATDLLDEAKQFFAKAESALDPAGKAAFLHAALLIGFASFEAHVNAIADEFLTREDLNAHERGLLAEHDIELSDGEFKEKTRLKIHRLEDRVLFLCRRFSKKPIDRASSYWGNFVDASKLRNGLTHPKDNSPNIQEAAVKKALMAMIDLLNHMCLGIYKKKLPAHNCGLSSKLDF